MQGLSRGTRVSLGHLDPSPTHGLGLGSGFVSVIRLEIDQRNADEAGAGAEAEAEVWGNGCSPGRTLGRSSHDVTAVGRPLPVVTSLRVGLVPSCGHRFFLPPLQTLIFRKR